MLLKEIKNQCIEIYYKVKFYICFSSEDILT